MRQKLIMPTLAAATAVFTFNPPAALASERSTAMLEEIVVTARRRQESSQDVPISMALYEQERLENLNIVSAVDLATYTPSLNFNSTFGSENASLAIRGFNQVIDTAPTVGIYFADVVVPRGPTQGTGTRDVLLPGSMYDLRNLQVLRGPQGTLFGRNTTGGAILLVPEPPSDEFGGYVEGSLGNYDMTRLQGALNLPLGDAVRMRISADTQKRDGYVENISGAGSDEFEDMDYKAARASLIWDVTDKLENYIVLSYYESDTNGTLTKLIGCDPTGYEPFDLASGLANFFGVFSCAQLDDEASRGADFYDVQTPVDGMSRIEQWQLINTTTWDINENLTLKNILSYAEYENTQRTPLFGTNWQLETLPEAFQAFFFRDIPAVFTGINPAPGRVSSDQSTYTEELQLQGMGLGERLTYQAGIYLEWSDPESVVGGQSPTLLICEDIDALDCIDPLGSAFSQFVFTTVGNVGIAGSETTFRNRGIYGQSIYDLTDDIKLTAGIRYTWDEQKTKRFSRTATYSVLEPFPPGPTIECTISATEPSCEENAEVTSEEPTWLLGLDYFPAEDTMLYAKYSRGYRAGGIVTRAPFDYRTFEPEQLDNYEIGAKTSFQGVVSGQVNVALFYNDLTNQQIQIGFSAREFEDGTTSGAAPVTGIANASEAEIYGAELEATIIPLEGLRLGLSYTWLETEIKKIDDIVTEDPLYQADTTAIEPGSPLQRSPENQLTLSANYDFPVSSSLGFISAGLTYVYVDEQYTTYLYQDPALREIYGDELGKIPSLDLLSANLSWSQFAGKPLNLSFYVTNLTDEEYYTFVPGLGGVGLETAGLGQPRMYGFRLRYHFGAD